MGLREIGFEHFDWLHLAPDKLLWKRKWNFSSHTRRVIFWLAEWL
jgi:hypothetical protein